MAAGDDRGRRVERHVDGPRQHARALFTLLDDVLGAMDAAKDDVQSLILADGPGGFTGLRVGAAVAKALHDASAIPVYTAPSLLGCALSARTAGTVLVTSEALRGDVFAAVYRFGEGSVECLKPPAVMAREEALELAPAAAALHDVPVDAGRLLELRGLQGGLVRVENVASWTPVYGRPAEAQARWEREHGRPLTHSPGLAG